MSARLPRLSGRARSAAAIAVAASTLVVGVGFGTASAATATPRTTNAATVKVAARTPHARQRVVFLFHSKFSVGAKSRWSIGFGDSYAVSGKGRAPAKVWHVFSTSGRYAVRFSVVDAKGATHFAKVIVTVAKAVPGVTAPVGASGVAGVGGAVTTTLNGVVVTTTPQGVPVLPSASAPATPSTLAPSTAVPTTTAPVVIPTVVPTTIPTVVPTTIPTVVPTTIPTVVPTTIPTVVPTSVVPSIVAPVVNLLLGLNVSGLLHGQVLNFTTSTVLGSSAIATWAVTWGDGTTSSGTGTAPTALTHTYSSIGTHTAHLTETAVDGASAVSTNLLFVTV